MNIRSLAAISSILVVLWTTTTSSTHAGTVEFVSCTAGGVAAPWLVTRLEGYASQATDVAKDKMKNILCSKWPLLCSLGGASAITSVPVIDSATKNAITGDTSNTNSKELWMDTIARCGAREILNKISGNIVNTARTSGRNGGTSFIQNWRNYITSSQYRGESIFRTILSNTKVCEYMESGVKQGFGVTKKLPLSGLNTRTGSTSPFQLTANCTMPSSFSMNDYMKDFSGNGGWEAFNRLLETQNNPIGMALLAGQEISNQRDLEQQADQAEALANDGYQGISGKNANDSCELKDQRGKCIKYKDIKTPGSYVAANLAAVVQQELAWIGSVDEIGELVANLTEIVLNRLLDLSNPDEGDAYIEDPMPAMPVVPPTVGCENDLDTDGYQHEALVSAAIDSVKNDPAYEEAMSVVACEGCGEPRIEGYAYPQWAVEKLQLGVILYVRGQADMTAGRIWNGCESGAGLIGSESVMIGATNSLGAEVYDLKSGDLEGSGATLGEAARPMGSNKLADWSRIAPDP